MLLIAIILMVIGLFVILPTLIVGEDYWKVVTGLFRTVGRLVVSDDHLRHAIMIILAFTVAVLTVLVTAQTMCAKGNGIGIDPSAMKDSFQQLP